MSAWTGKWIEPTQERVTEEPEFSLAQMFGGAPLLPQAPIEERLHPTRLLRRVFETRRQVARATLRMTARGLYQAWLDGVPVSDAVLLPGGTRTTRSWSTSGRSSCDGEKAQPEA